MPLLGFKLPPKERNSRGGLLKPSCREGDGKRPPYLPISPLPWADSNILPSVERLLHMIKEIHAHCENINK